jgi:hypothetical protein
MLAKSLLPQLVPSRMHQRNEEVEDMVVPLTIRILVGGCELSDGRGILRAHQYCCLDFHMARSGTDNLMVTTCEDRTVFGRAEVTQIPPGYRRCERCGGQSGDEGESELHVAVTRQLVQR